ncbi:MAG: sugar transferase [archaeon]
MFDLLYCKKAVGKDGIPFIEYKLRTMRVGAEREFSTLFDSNGLDESGKINEDPRITPVGKYLRRYWIDEIPQLINILKGEMTLVGIRPSREEEWEKYPQEFRERIKQFKPGLCSPIYAHEPTGDLDRLVEIQSEYLDKKERNPIRTDVSYVAMIAYNFIVKGRRSR